MATKKKYGVFGMMDWIANIPCGKAIFKVPFSGGSLNGYGVVPANYTTKDVVIQHAIENSDYFKKGKIKLLKEYEIADSLPPTMRKTTTANQDEAPAVAPTVVAPKTEANDEASGDSINYVEVTDIDEARDYLVEKCGIQRSAIRSAINVFRTADELGIKFDGIEYH